jgi:tetratricopeptide (TPR) repeat protein/CHAT domain-containing protein
LALLVWLGAGGLTRAEEPPLTAEQRERLKERDRLAAEAGKLLEEGKLAATVTAWEKKLAIERQVFGDLHEAVVQSLQGLAGLHEFREDFAAARKARKEVLALCRKLHGDKDWRVTDARLALADSERLAGFDAAGRSRYWEAVALANAVDERKQKGRVPEAVGLAKQVIAIRRNLLGKAHPAYARSLNDLAKLYQDMGNYPKALPLDEEARAITKKALGSDHPDYAASLNDLARLYQAMGDYPKALPLLEEARAIIKKALGTDHPTYAASLNNLAMLYQVMGDYSKALPLCEEARAIWKKALGTDHPDYATSLNNLAGLYRVMGDYPKALPLYEEARAIYQKALGPDHPDYATSLNNLALLYQVMGDYPKALPLCEEARAIRKKALSPDHPDYATSLSDLAALYRAKGDYPKALPLFQEARAITKKALGTDHPDYATSLNNLAVLYQVMGDYPKALPLYEEARALTKKALGTDHPDYATSVNNLARLYQAMRDYPKALPLYEEARALTKKALGPDHPDYATSLNNLAGLYRAMEDYPKALPLYEEARALRKKALGPDHPDYATSLNNLALLYQVMGDYPKALPLFEEARAITKKALGTDHPDYATRLNNLAGLYSDMGDYPKALPLFEEARAITKKAVGTDHPDYATRLNNLAALYQAMSQSAQAATLLRQSLTLRRTFLDRTLTVQSDRQRLTFLAAQRVTLNAYLSVATSAGLSAGQIYAAVLAWKGALAARQAEEGAARGRPDLLPTLDQLRQTRAGLARLYQQQSANAAQKAHWLEQFQALEARKEQLEVDLAGASETYRRFRELHAATADQVAAALPPRTALLDFVQYIHYTPPPKGKGQFQQEERLLAFVLARSRPLACVPLGPADALDQAAQAWWRDLMKPGTDPHPAGAALAQCLWTPLVPALGGATTVLIAPDGVVCGLPFAALPGTKRGTFVLEERAIGYVTSGRHLLELAADSDRPAAAGLLAVGGLTYGDPPVAAAPPPRPDYLARGGAWRPLPGTRLEAEQIAARFRTARPDPGETRLLTGAEADAERLRRELQPIADGPRWRYLHLATHGFFDPPLPAADPARRPKDETWTFGEWREHLTYRHNPLLRAGLVLAGANRDPEHGFLTAEEVAGLDLGGCDLAVLSACETGLGKVADGEGMLGLQRAFQAAGARTLVASLWGVNDAATSVLMEEFYANLCGKQLPKLEALRQAQLTVLRHPERVQQRAEQLTAQRGIRHEAVQVNSSQAASPRRSPVSWWAAFVLSGETGDLSAIQTEQPTEAPVPLDPPAEEEDVSAESPASLGWLLWPVVGGIAGVGLLAAGLVWYMRRA